MNNFFINLAFGLWTKGSLCPCICLQSNNNKSQTNGFQYLFSVAPSVITLIKSAESIRKKKITIWLLCDLTDPWVKDFKWVQRHGYVLCTLQNYLTMQVLLLAESFTSSTQWTKLQNTTSEKKNSNQIAQNLTYCDSASREREGKYIYPCCYAHFWKLVSEQVYKFCQVSGFNL